MTFKLRRFLGRAGVIATAAVVAVLSFGPTSAHAALPGASSQLTPAPYLTDLTEHSVRVTWATTGQSKGTVRFGPPPPARSRPPRSVIRSPSTALPSTKLGVSNWSVDRVRLLLPRVHGWHESGGPARDQPLATVHYTGRGRQRGSVHLCRVGDWGDTTNSGVNNGSLNVNQAGVAAQIAASGARFALSTGDIGYPGGTQTNYGDLNQTGVNISAVFGPSTGRCRSDRADVRREWHPRPQRELPDGLAVSAGHYPRPQHHGRREEEPAQ